MVYAMLNHADATAQDAPPACTMTEGDSFVAGALPPRNGVPPLSTASASTTGRHSRSSRPSDDAPPYWRPTPVCSRMPAGGWLIGVASAVPARRRVRTRFGAALEELFGGRASSGTSTPSKVGGDGGATAAAGGGGARATGSCPPGTVDCGAFAVSDGSVRLDCRLDELGACQHTTNHDFK